MTTKHKMLFQIEALIYNGDKAVGSRNFTFFRPYCTKTPTFSGAARMIANEIGVKPSDVSVMRIESNVYQCR